MHDWPDYELIDFGEGRKLERFGAWVFDRPCPTAAGVSKRRPKLWQQRKARFNGQRAGGGEWEPNPYDVDDGRFELDRVPLVSAPVDAGFKLMAMPRPGGQVGLFPEQFANWQWIAARVRASSQPLNVLNLFAYTGGSTLAAACAGASVVHVDAAKPIVEQASFNASQSGVETGVRWIVEDAVKFCRREARRGNRYDAVILDPPTYGHGPKSEEWLLKRDLLPLLELCGELTERRPKFALVTCHTPGVGPAELAAYLADGLFGHCGQPPRAGELFLETADGRRLPSGVYARWPG
jgi:23S rRNA (cytosine1962-C5)-methyltransferase